MRATEDLVERIRRSLNDTLLSEREKTDLISAVLTGRPTLILGPRGTLKEDVASRVLSALEVPVVTVNCSSSLRREDLFGDVDPLALREFGYADERSYTEGLIQKGNGGALFLKDLDALPDKLCEALAEFIDDGIVAVGRRELRVETRIVAIANSASVSERLLDRFQVVEISYPEDRDEERDFIAKNSRCEEPPPPYVLDFATAFLARSRRHPDLESGASTRSAIRFVEDVCACMRLSGRKPDEQDLFNSCYAAFSHSIDINPFSWKTRRELTRNIFEEAILSVRETKKPPKRASTGLARYRIPIIAGLLISLLFVFSFWAMRGNEPAVTIPPANISPKLNATPSRVEGNSTSGGKPVEVPTNILREINRTIGSLAPGGNVSATFDERTDRLFITAGNKTWVLTNYTGLLLRGNTSAQGSQGGPGPPSPSGSGGPSIFRALPPFLLLFLFASIIFLSTFLFDYLGVGRRIRDSKVMTELRRRFGISWEPLTSLYRNIAKEVSPLSRRLEGSELGEAVKEISAARDTLYAEKARDRASLAEIVEFAKRKPERYPALSQILDDAKSSERRPEKQLISDLRRHLEREGLIGKSKEVHFTHRVSKFLLSDVDERILRRVYAALRGATYEELPPLPSSDVKDVRKYRRGDSYKDIAIRESLRDAIRRGRTSVESDSLYVYEREPERREVVMQGDADVVVVLDLSGSMAYGDKLWYAKQAIVVMTIIAERYGNRVGVVGFRDLSTEVSELGLERNQTISRVANLLPRGGTNIAAGIRRSIDLLVGEEKARKREFPDPSAPPGRKKQVILLTDGDATHPKPKQFAAEYARRAARLAAKFGILISVVCIGREDDASEAGHSYNPELAADIAEIGRGRLFFVRDMRDLSAVFVSEVDELMMKTALPQMTPTSS